MNNLVFISLFLMSSTVLAQLKPFYTTRLIGTAGAGVGSILANEASVLNPASIVFIPLTNFYYQRSDLKTEQSAPERADVWDDGSLEIYQASDTSSSLKGTLSYQKQARAGYERQKIVSSLASQIGDQTALGFIYSYNQGITPGGPEDNFHQVSVGLTHIFNARLTMGLVYQDAFKGFEEESVAIAGLQYQLFRTILLIQDFAYHNVDKVDDFTFRSAIQINFYKDLYLRGGVFQNRQDLSRGQAWGLSWIGPKLSFEYAVMQSQFYGDSVHYRQGDEDIVSSLAVSFRY